MKYLLVGFLYGIPSERQIEQRIQTDVAFRWYLGIDLDKRAPDHSTVSQLRRRKPAFRKVFRQLFEEVVRQCVEKGLVSGRLAATDSTHVKANASRASEQLVEMEEEAGNYWERLDNYEEEGLEELGIKFFIRPQPAHGRTRVEFKRNAFAYDARQDVYLCPNENVLHVKGLYRGDSGLFWEYWADKKDCSCCPLREKCLSAEDKRGAENSWTVTSSPLSNAICPGVGSRSTARR